MIKIGKKIFSFIYLAMITITYPIWWTLFLIVKWMDRDL